MPEDVASEPGSATVLYADHGESAVMIAMYGDHLVIRPPEHLDLHLTTVLVDAIAAALQNGATVMLDLDPDTDSGDLLTVAPVLSMGSAADAAGASTVIVGPATVRIATADSLWTIDIARGRLFRSDVAVDPAFVGADDWIGVRALWLNCTSLTALTAGGAYVSAHPDWSLAH